MPIPTASPELKNKIETICPNEFDLNTPDWLKIAAKALSIDYTRLTRIWRDNRSKLRASEIQIIEQKLLEKTLRTQAELKQSLAYHEHIIGTRLHEEYSAFKPSKRLSKTSQGI